MELLINSHIAFRYAEIIFLNPKKLGSGSSSTFFKYANQKEKNKIIRKINNLLRKKEIRRPF